MGSEAIILPAAFFTVGWMVYVVVDGFRRRQRLKVFTDLHTRLLDRMGSATEFGAFFSSQAGTRLLNSLSEETGGAHVRILNAVQTGFVALALGVGLFALATIRSFSIDTNDLLAVLATIATAVGVGLVASAIVSAIVSRRMGLFGGGRRQHELDPTDIA